MSANELARLCVGGMTEWFLKTQEWCRLDNLAHGGKEWAVQGSAVQGIELAVQLLALWGGLFFVEFMKRNAVYVSKDNCSCTLHHGRV
jgi:hypothetical protein